MGKKQGFWQRFRRKFFGKEARRQMVLFWLDAQVFPKLRQKRPNDAGEIIALILDLVNEV